MRKGPVRSTIEKGISTPHALRQAAQDPHPRNQPTPRRRHHRAREAQQLRIPVPQRQGGVRTSFAPRLAATCEESRGAEERDPARPKTDTIEKSYRCVSLKGRAHAITCKTRWILNCMLSPVASHYRILGALAWRIKNAFPSWSRLAKKNLLLRRRGRSGQTKHVKERALQDLIGGRSAVLEISWRTIAAKHRICRLNTGFTARDRWRAVSVFSTSAADDLNTDKGEVGGSSPPRHTVFMQSFSLFPLAVPSLITQIILSQ